MDYAAVDLESIVHNCRVKADKYYPGWSDGKLQNNVIPSIFIPKTDQPRRTLQESNVKGDVSEKQVRLINLCCKKYTENC